MYKENISKEKRIAKNTIFLYVRMLFLLLINLYTSRVVLDKLGVTDFGIYNVVGGLTLMFGFFNSAFANATQRFINIELGRNNVKGASNVFNQHLLLYLIIIGVVLIVAECIGPWFISNRLTIPPDRLFAAHLVFQFTLLALAATLCGIVFNSVILAHENMKVYSYVGISEGIMGLIVAYVISMVSFDKLITYALLLTLIKIGAQLSYATYCFCNYTECRLFFYWNKSMLREASSFVGYNLLGTVVFVLNDQGVNILLNMFFGPVVNAARAVAYQVNSAVSNFGNNFFIAVRPQLIKSYAQKDRSYLIQLFYKTSRYAEFLVWIFCLPLILRSSDVLNLWLTNVPDQAPLFTSWVLVYLLVCILHNPIWETMMATGNIKYYMIIGCAVFVLNLPVSYIFLSQDYPAVSVFVIIVVVRVIYMIVSLVILHRYLNFSYRLYVTEVVIPILTVIGLSAPIAYLLNARIPHDVFGTFVSLSIIFMMSCAVVWYCGIDKGDKRMILEFISKKLRWR